MLKFKVNDRNELDIDWQIITFEPFLNIIKLDKKDRKKKRAKQLLLYIYLREDISNSNTIGKMEYESRIAEAERVCFDKKKGGMKLTKKERELVAEAIKTYVKYSATPKERMLSSISAKLDMLNQRMEELNIDDKEFEKKLKGISDNINQLLKQEKTLMDNIKGNVSGKVRADENSSLNEMNLFANIKSEFNGK